MGTAPICMMLLFVNRWVCVGQIKVIAVDWMQTVDPNLSVLRVAVGVMLVLMVGLRLMLLLAVVKSFFFPDNYERKKTPKTGNFTKNAVRLFFYWGGKN